MDLARPIRLAPRTRDIQFDFTALSLVEPRRHVRNPFRNDRHRGWRRFGGAAAGPRRRQGAIRIPRQRRGAAGW
jgi:hypothetical protein